MDEKDNDSEPLVKRGRKVKEIEVTLLDCKNCLQNKPNTDFYQNSRFAPRGYSTWCKNCLREKCVKNQKARREAKKLAPESQPDDIKTMALCLLDNPSISVSELAQRCGMSSQSVKNWLMSNIYIRALRALATGELSRMIPAALKALNETLHATNAEAKLKAALKILENESVMGAAKVEIKIDDIRSLPIERIREMVAKAQALPPPSIDATLIPS